jgi:maleamate amidohydrolase
MTPDKGSGLEQLFGFYDKRGYQHRVGAGKRPAIVVIDFSNAFTAGQGDFPGGDFSKEMSATLRMLRVARAKRIPIFYTTIAYADPQQEAGLWGKKVPWLYHCKVGTAAVEIDPRLEARPNEPVIVKRFPSALYETDLLARLKALRIDTVLLAGCTTSVCVRATTIDMMQHGFMTLPVADAIGEFDPQLHALHLKDLDSRYADVVSIDDALAYLSALDENASVNG